MADKIETGSSAGSQEEIADRRREKRYTVPDACQKHIKLRVRRANEFVPALLGNFSRNGILFECPLSFQQGEHAECSLSFGIEVKYCYSDHGSYITVASIDTISDEKWFDIFVEAHDFIVLRQSSV